MSDEQFQRTHLSNNPGIVGARWWQESLAISGDPVARRQALASLTVVGVSLLGLGVVGSLVCASSGNGGSSTSPGSDERVEKRSTLDVQRDYGWNFGAEEDAVTFDGQTVSTFDRSALDRMVTDLKPAQASLQPYYVPTLFQSISATPRLTIEGRTTPIKPLRDVIVPSQTAAMKEAYRQGKALASLFEGTPTDRIVLVDLPGPAAVAFAAGACPTFEPVFAFDNWPHPLGVVPSHQTLAAVAYYQPLFVKAKGMQKPSAYPLLVLDRSRLNAYTSEGTQFDNRYFAKLPAVAALKGMGIKHVLYVTPSATYPLESDDLNADLVEYGGGGVDTKMVAASDFIADPAAPASPPPGQPIASPDDWPPYYYGGSSDTHFWFWNDVGWNKPQRPPRAAPHNTSGLVQNYRPGPRTTMFSGTGTGPTKSRPTSLGLTPVLVAVATGVVVGTVVSRSGSFRRYSGGSSWGGG